MFGILFLFLLSIFLLFQRQVPLISSSAVISHPQKKAHVTPTPSLSPLAIAYLQQQKYPASSFHEEKILPDGKNYHQSIVSYTSEGLKIYALLTVPVGEKPKNGWPAVIFNHGYIAPDEYETAPLTGQYASYVAALASQGFVVLKPDYRGNGLSEGNPQQPYISNGYIVDDLIALSSLKKDSNVDPQRIGVWAHSMGGFITLDDLVITKDIKAAVIWSGVVGSASQLIDWWHKRHLTSANDIQTRTTVQTILQQLGTPQTNSTYWKSVDPTEFLRAIATPVQLHVGLADATVPPDFTTSLANKLQKAGKSVELFQYPGDDHNISHNFTQAMQRSITFFKTNL